MQEVITIKNLSKIYAKGKIKIPALNGIDLKLNKGEFISIVGRSGSGKSTLLNIIGGLDHATEGEIVVNGKDLSVMSRKELARHRKYTAGMIFQSFNLIPSQNAWENVALALAFGGVKRKNRKSRASELLVSVGLENRIHHTPAELSGGEAQRVAIARALANNPEIILADEPTGNLDSITAEEIMEILLNLNKKYNKTIIMVTHDLETADKVSDRLIKLKDGKLIN
jgi:putative ABC transport system ATP-binding protein